MESVSWQSAHYEEPYYTQRKAKLPSKLMKLGVLGLDRNARILDTCCGRGDLLNLLFEHGFHNIEGVDATPHPDWETMPFNIQDADVLHTPFEDSTFDYVMNLHALHHMGGFSGVEAFFTECHRILKPGGKLFIIDFPASPQIKLLFFLLRKRIFVPTGGLDNFARILDEEWGYLSMYLEEWPVIRTLFNRYPFHLEHSRQEFFLFYRTQVKR